MERESCSGSSRLVRITAFAAVRGILDVLARQYGAIGAEIGSIDKSILALHRSCEVSRRLAEIPGIGPLVATALVAEIGDWKAFSSGRILLPGSGWCPSSIRPAARTGSAASPSRAIDTCAGCWLSAPWPSSATQSCTVREPAVARTINRAPADQGGGCRARQQDCTHGLGHHGRGERYKEPKLSMAT